MSSRMDWGASRMGLLTGDIDGLVSTDGSIVLIGLTIGIGVVFLFGCITVFVVVLGRGEGRERGLSDRERGEGRVEDVTVTC